MLMDKYPGDITLKVTNQDSGEILLQKTGYNVKNGLEVESLCIAESPGNKYKVRIDDKYGDGVCCHWGRGVSFVFLFDVRFVYLQVTRTNARDTAFHSTSFFVLSV